MMRMADLLEPWMLQSDWRAEPLAFLLVDMAAWPAGVPLEPRPPMPLIGLGAADHPLARQMDIVEDPAIGLQAVFDGIEQTPRTARVLVDLLRATEHMPAEHALICESFAYATLQAGEEHRAWRAAQPLEPLQAEGGVTVSRSESRLDLVLERPWARNAIDRTMRDELVDAFTLARIDDGVSCITLRGAGKCFSVGADLSEFGTMTDPAEAHRIRMLTLPARALLPRADRLEAHVAGGCVGSGLELAAFARRLTATSDAWFQLPEVGMGILPGAGGGVSIPRRIGRQRAALLMLSCRRINARTALRWGLIDEIVDDAAVDHRHAHEMGG